jgi:carbamate kinase
MRNDAGEQLYGIVPMPIDICVADSQGGIGYMIERMLRNVLQDYGLKREVVTLVSMVLVDPNDPSLTDPTKRIGKIYNRDEAEYLSKTKNWQFKPTVKKNDSFRRVVPSLCPTIFNGELVRSLSEKGVIVITAGGGGIPVFMDENKNLRTVDEWSIKTWHHRYWPPDRCS